MAPSLGCIWSKIRGLTLCVGRSNSWKWGILVGVGDWRWIDGLVRIKLWLDKWGFWKVISESGERSHRWLCVKSDWNQMAHKKLTMLISWFQKKRQTRPIGWLDYTHFNYLRLIILSSLFICRLGIIIKSESLK